MSIYSSEVGVRVLQRWLHDTWSVGWARGLNPVHHQGKMSLLEGEELARSQGTQEMMRWI